MLGGNQNACPVEDVPVLDPGHGGTLDDLREATAGVDTGNRVDGCKREQLARHLVHHEDQVSRPHIDGKLTDLDPDPALAGDDRMGEFSCTSRPGNPCADDR